MVENSAQKIREEVLKELRKAFPKHPSAVDVMIGEKAIDLAIQKTAERIFEEIEKIFMDVDEINATEYKPNQRRWYLIDINDFEELKKKLLEEK